MMARSHHFDDVTLKGSLEDQPARVSDEEKSVGPPAREAGTGAGTNAAAFTIPDGGWRAWSVVLGSTLALFVSFGYVRYISFRVPNECVS